MPVEPVDAGEAAVVKGVKGEGRVDPPALRDEFQGRRGPREAERRAACGYEVRPRRSG